MFQDMFILHTPGGGAYGCSKDSDTGENLTSTCTTFIERGSIHEYKRVQESA